jgi:uncharacterized membrane protein
MVKDKTEKEIDVDRVKCSSTFSFGNWVDPRNPNSYPKETITAESNSANAYSRHVPTSLGIFVVSAFALPRPRHGFRLNLA